MKQSYYNIITTFENEIYVYNVLYNSLIRLNKVLLNKILDNNINKISRNQLSILIKNGIIIDDKIDELELIKYRHNSVKYNQNQYSFIIYPTLKCNLSCNYCFEKVERTQMSKEKLLILNKFLVKIAAKRNVDFLHVRWSGGEPLILWNAISSINKNIQEVCLHNNVKFTSSLCTNATLLTDEIADRISELQISPITVSIDGPSVIHDKRRFYSNRKGTFTDVIKGINLLAKYNDIILRINIDTDNKDSFSLLLEELDNNLINKNKCILYIKNVCPSYGCHEDETMYKDDKFKNIEFDLIDKAKEKGFRVYTHPGFGHSTRCVVYQKQSFLIDPELYLYKCPLYLGNKEKSIGYIDDEAEIFITDSYACQCFTNYSPLSIEECKQCKILPLCNGKCLATWKKNNSDKFVGCIPEKETFEKKLKDFIIPEMLKEDVQNF